VKLSELERGWLKKILEAVIPPGVVHSISPSAADAGAAKILEEMLRHLPAFTGLGLRASIVFVEFLGPVFGLRKAARFSMLPPEQREECLARMSKHDTYFVRQMVLLHKATACMGWGADDRVRQGLGYGLPPKFVKRDEEAGP
jgi:hypothetical protein